MIRTWYLIIAIIVTLIGLGAAAALHYRAEEERPALATATPLKPEHRFVALPGGNFSVVAPVDGNGQAADMAPFRGKRLLVNLWATWCAPCIKELPSLARLQQELGGGDFQVVTIAVQERDPAKVGPFLEQHGAGNLPVLIDRDDTIRAITQVTALPASLLVERDGTAKAMFTGDASWHCGNARETV